MFGIFSGIYIPSKKIDRTELDNGVIVSTVVSPDEGPETALIINGSAMPVQRYKTEKSAKAGHKKWVNFSKDCDGKTITFLGGFGGLVADKEYKIKL